MSETLLPSRRLLGSIVWESFCALASLSLLSGCAAANLNKLAITSIAVSQPKGAGIAPGEKSKFVVSMTDANGRLLATNTSGKQKIRWKDLNVKATVARVDGKGNVSLPSDPRASYGTLPHVTVTVPSHPDLRAELDIPLRYDRAFKAHFSGASGTSGMNGTDGIDGNSGSNGSSDPEHPSAGGNGSDGSRGGDGLDGGPGSDGPPVTVLVAVKGGTHPLLKIRVSAEGSMKYFMVDPDGGSLTVISEGGSGGSGGRGGHGGRGGSGGLGWPPGNSGMNGADGRDGNSGQAGNGGRITVLYDPLARSFLSAIHASSPSGPAPIFREQAVAAAW